MKTASKSEIFFNLSPSFSGFWFATEQLSYRLVSFLPETAGECQS